MNAHQSTVTAMSSFSNQAVARRRIAPAAKPDRAATPERQLLHTFRSSESVEPELIAGLESSLRREENPDRLWYLLNCLQEVPPRSVDREVIFAALCRLAKADAVLLRCSAYHWLAGLHRIDLRFETRAKLALRDRLSHEQGIARERLQHALRSC